MPAKTLYFTEIGPVWKDWIQVINIGNAPADVTCIARNGAAEPIWSVDKEVDPFTGWVPPVDQVKDRASLTITADQTIAAERHMHQGTQVLDFPGACAENKTVGKRLFFPELVPGALDWFRVLNVDEDNAHVSVIVRNSKGDVVRQHTRAINPFHWWEIDEKQMGNVKGTVEMVSTQMIVGERHLHYHGGKVTVGQLGQALDPE